MRTPSSISPLIDRLRGGGLATESAWGLLLELATLFGTVLSFLFLGRTLGAAGYGGYASLYAISGPLVTLAASGVVLAVLQHIVRDEEPLPETARSCLSITLLLGAGLTVAGSVVAHLVIENVSTLSIITILATEFVAVPIVQVAASVVQAGTNFTEAAKIRLVLVVGRMVLIIGLFAADVLTIEVLGVTMLTLSTVIGLRALREVGRRYDFTFRPGRPSMSHLKTNGIYSAAVSAASLNAEGDKLVLAANGLVVDTGLYAAAYRIVSFGMIPIGSLVAASHRRFLENEEGVKGQHLDRSLKFSLGAGAYGLVFGVALFVAAPALPIVMGDEFEGSVTMVRWLAPIVMLRALAMFAINGLMGLGREGLRTVILIVNAVIALAMYIVLVPIHGWEGAAIGTLASEVIGVVTTWVALVLCQRRVDRAIDAAAVESVEAASPV